MRARPVGGRERRSQRDDDPESNTHVMSVYGWTPTSDDGPG